MGTWVRQPSKQQSKMTASKEHIQRRVRRAQEEAGEGFLTESDVDKALDLFEAWEDTHETCRVYVAPTVEAGEVTRAGAEPQAWRRGAAS